ncbi:hypothetical protein DV515_00013052 [Chloebia gouldiae]|uniref:Peptidase S1 domain-containing protein n=1 Tax=Chloebia gouldiae TaxID=44316 RepID=A0A3L8S1W4_CHLGU|nr:hypothetical protein DV515_00013052 [Chloebia gouldiae]
MESCVDAHSSQDAAAKDARNARLRDHLCAALRDLRLDPAVTFLLLPQVDTGGPLVCSYWNTMKWFQVGIISGGKPNHRILTPVYSYQDWIEKETAIRGKPFFMEEIKGFVSPRVSLSAQSQLAFTCQLEHGAGRVEDDDVCANLAARAGGALLPMIPALQPSQTSSYSLAGSLES